MPVTVTPEKKLIGSIYEQRIMNYPFETAGSGYTFQTIRNIPFFDEMVLARVLFENHTTSATNVSSVAISSGRAVEDNPLLAADGSASPWSIIATNLAVPAANGVEGQKGHVFTPWTPIRIQPRTDGSAYGALYVRVYSTTNIEAPIVGNMANFNGIGFLNNSVTYYQGGDKCSANQASFSPTNRNTFYIPTNSIQIMSAKKSITIAAVGDSITQGLNTTSDNANFLIRAADKLSTVSRPVGFCNYGSSGQTSAYYTNQVLDVLADSERLPSVLIIQAATVNDSPIYTQATIDTGFASMLSLAALCRSKGVIPIFRTATPHNGMGSDQDAVRNKLNNYIRNSNVPVLDMDAILSDGATPVAHLKSQYAYSDYVHVNDAGHAAVADALVSLVGNLNL